MKNITTIFFDIDGTLIDHIGAQDKAIEYVRKKYLPGSPEDKFRQSWIKFTRKNWSRFEKGEISFHDQKMARVKDTWVLLDKNINSKHAEKVVEEYVSEYESKLTNFPSVTETLQYLSKKGYRLGAITNGSYAQQIKKLKKINAYKLFEKKLIIISEKIGCAKPDMRIFSHAQKISKASPNNIAFFGDNVEVDIIPAKNLNWLAILADYANLSSHLKLRRILSFKEIKEIF